MRRILRILAPLLLGATIRIAMPFVIDEHPDGTLIAITDGLGLIVGLVATRALGDSWWNPDIENRDRDRLPVTWMRERASSGMGDHGRHTSAVGAQR